MNTKEQTINNMEVTMTDSQETMVQTTFNTQFNQFTPNVFKNELFGEFRVFVDKAGEIWFVGHEVATALGYGNPRDAIMRNVRKVHILSGVGIPDASSSQRRPTTLIHELGLYSLIARSNKPEAEPFQDWIYDTIKEMRKYGLSMTPQVRKIFEENASLRQTLNSAQSAIHLYDEITNDEYFITMRVIASNYGTSAQDLNTILHKLGFHYPCGNGWVLYEPYRSMGLAKTRSRKAPDGNTYEITIGYNEKGRIEIDKLLHSQGLLTEQEKMIEHNRLLQQQNQQAQQPVQPQTVNNYITNNNHYYGFSSNVYPPGYKPTPVTHIGKDGREYTDKDDRLVVMTDRNGYPL